MRVEDDGFCIRLNGVRAIADGRSHPICLVCIAVGFHDHVSSLPDTECHNLGLIRLDGHEVIRHDSHLVSINTEFLDTFRAGIDQSQSMLLAGCELEFRKSSVVDTRRTVGDERAIVIHLPIDEIVNAFRRHKTQIRAHYFLDDVVVLLVVVVCQQDGTEIDIVLHVLGTVDDHWADQAAGVLRAVVGMIPGCAVEICFERIVQAFTGSNGALLDCWDAVFPLRTSLQEAMPVKGCSFFRTSDFIVDFYSDGVAPVCFDGRAGKLSVD